MHMHTRGREGARLPPELMERVLSFLPVPDLCRFRSVCKSWKELLYMPHFHELCDAHRGTRKPYLFLTRTSFELDPRPPSPLRGTVCFLDLDERRCYSINAGKDFLRAHNLRHHQAADNGLVCEFRGRGEGQRPVLGLILSFDPIAKSSRTIPLPCRHLYSSEIAFSVDDVGCSFRIFIAKHRESRRWDDERPFLYVYESSTQNWRGTRNPPSDIICPSPNVMSSALFHGRLYQIFKRPIYWSRSSYDLLSYDCEGDTWTSLICDGNLWRTWTVSEDQNSELTPCLVVSSDRLFLMRWVWEPDASFWMHEIIDGSLCKKGLRIITKDSADHLFPERICSTAAVLIDFRSDDGSCSSVVFVSESSGRVWTYELATQTVDFFPANPAFKRRCREHRLRMRYDPKHWGMHMHLNLRNVLSSC